MDTGYRRRRHLVANADDGLGYRADAANPAFTNYGQVFTSGTQPYWGFQVNDPVVNAPGGTVVRLDGRRR